MRVITGSARGRKLTAPDGMDVRPTADMVKEAIFTIVHFQVPGARVLDLFAGSGQLGIEALSRGAAQAVFIDHNSDSIAHIKANLNATKLFDKARVAHMDSVAYIKRCTEKFDLAFLDPPYGKGLMETTLPYVADVMNEGGIIVCETDKAESLPQAVGVFRLYKEYRYGKKKITTYREKAPEAEE